MTAADKPAEASAQRPLGAALSRATSDVKGIATLLLAIATVPAAFVALRDAVHLPSPWPEILCIVPIAIFIGLYLVPEWRGARDGRALEEYGIHGNPPPPGYFRLTAYGADDRAKFTRPDGAEAQALKWIKGSKDAFLYLVGLSGVGKSSLLSAHVIPEMKDAGWVVVEARPYDNPVGALAAALVRPGAIWKQPPSIELRPLLERAAAAVAKTDKRLLVLLDQFEEVLILLGEQERQPFAALLKDLNERPIENLTVLLSLRLDYIGGLEALPIPPPTYGANWFEVKRFTPAAARGFIERSDLKPGAKLVDQVLREAAEIEDSLDQVRPVVINMYGLVLASFKGRLPPDLVAGRLLAGYVRRSLDRSDLREVSRAVIAPLVTDVGTKRARPLDEIAGQARTTKARARGALLHLAEDGLVRAVDKAGQRWEAAHDFVARLTLPLLETARTTWWDRMRPWLAPGAIAVWATLIALVALIYPEWHQARLRVRLAEAGLAIASSPSPAGTAFQFINVGATSEALTRALPLLTEVRPPVLSLYLDLMTITILHERVILTSIASLPTLPALTSLHVADADLTSLAGLPSLPALTTLNLSRNALTSLAGLPNFPALRTLDLASNRLTSLAGLPNFPTLKELDLTLNDLTSLAGLPTLQTLTTLDLYGNRLTSLAGLPNFPALTTLNLANNNELTALGDLPNLPALHTLNVSGTGVTSLPSLPHNLKRLYVLNLKLNRPLDLSALANHSPTLEVLMLGSTPVADYAGLARLTRLLHINLEGSEVLDLSVLAQMRALKSVGLMAMSNLDLRPLESLPALEEIVVSRSRKETLKVPPTLEKKLRWQ